MEKSEQIQPHVWILGVDVSKQSIDACLVHTSDGQLFESKFHNNLSGFRHLKRWCKEMKCECDSSTLCCMEHTGCTHACWFIICWGAKYMYGWRVHCKSKGVKDWSAASLIRLMRNASPATPISIKTKRGSCNCRC